MSQEQGFAPIARPDARVLILGSMPGRASLDQHEYYGHRQNAFWRIMSDYTSVEAEADYAQRTEGLLRQRIAVWDVIAACFRPGSLDSAISAESIEVNAFDAFFERHSGIEAIFFNGAKAAAEYRRRVLPKLRHGADLIMTTLLSTSPANARFSLEQKKESWSALRPFLERDQPDG